MADGPTIPTTSAATPAAAPVAPAKPKALAWPQDFDPKKQGRGYPILIAPAVWALIHGSDPSLGFRAGGVAPFDTGKPEAETAYGPAGSFMRHVGKEDDCQVCGARVSQITRNNGPVCIGCGNVRKMIEES